MRILRLFIPPRRIILWLAIFTVGIIFFALFRTLFLIIHLSLIDDSSIGDILHSFWIGFRYDALVLCCIILPFYLVWLLPFIKLSSKLFQRILVISLSIIFFFLFLISAADLRYFDAFGSRMNYWVIDYIEYPLLFLYSAISHPDFWKLLALLIGSLALFYFVIDKLIKKIVTLNLRTGIIKKSLFNLITMVLLVLGIRGSLGVKPLDWGTAFFCENQFLNQMSLNGVYTLFHSISEEIQEGYGLFGGSKRFAFYDIKDAYRTVLGMLNIEPGNTTKALSLEHPIVQPARFGFSPNVIIIIMESWSADKIGALGSPLGISPRFDELCSHGILFKNFYANGVRTNRGIPAVLCSFPSLPGRSMMKRYGADHPFRSIAEILKPYNYNSSFAYGGDINFDNIAGFLRTVGYETIYGENDFDRSRELGKWGIPDHVIFDELVHKIASFPRPFHLAVMTISNHDPYLIPDNRFKLYDDTIPGSNILNTFYYSDWAIGQFIDSLKKEPLFDSTIFIFTADHCLHLSGKYPLAPANFHIPLLIYSPKLIGDRAVTINKISSQVDILPTLVGLMGLSTKEYSWGRDILNLSNDDSGFAVIVAEDRLGLIEDSYFYFHWMGAGNILYDLSDPEYLKYNLSTKFPQMAERMETRLCSYIELANYLSRGGKKK